ncbi:hypothetical protein SLS62_009958 [Diatrype stigma]|uniref:Ketoreductase domain-containing protein n=1 Tax=Diatrype stigma TaxID=117547 RepID=A0AAN9UJ34_9PEZI
MAEVKPLKNKVILITGAGQGIGAAVARYIAARGAIVSLSDIVADRVKAVEQQLRDRDAEFQGLSQAVDVCDPDSVKKWVEETKSQFGRIDGAVNSAGVLQKEVVSLTEISLDEWKRVIDVNLTGTFNCLKHELVAIADGGSIVNLASVAGQYGILGLAPYTASKHGVVGLTRVAAADAAARQIRVNIVCPGVTDTEMGNDFYTKAAGRLQGKIISLLPGLLRPDDIAASIAFLLGDESRSITRAVYQIDGGFAA